jgi:hypothetical protein
MVKAIIRRRVSTVVLCVLVAACVLVDSGPDPTARRVTQLSKPYRWNVLAWEARHVPSGLQLAIAQAAAPPDQGQAMESVRAYLRGAQAVQSEGALSLALAWSVSEELRRGGVGSIGGAVFPPVTFALASPPRLLVVSPRHEIRLAHWALLDGGTALAAGQRLERAVEGLDVSALVVDAVALGTFPALIPTGVAPPAALQTIAHEWTHVALFLSPVGRAYGASSEARAINETTADLVGEEVARGILNRLGIPVAEQTRGRDDPRLRETLRRVRLEVDRLLTAGRVAEAEDYMEAERLALVQAGYRIRRLNQAFFAFYGDYAEGPAASSEIPDGLRELRRRSDDLGGFLDRVGKVTTVGELRVALEQAGTP